ncbi:hypothetical protein [Paenibacillus glycanilyticus]|uniref:Uncharacterized protein n=1 Tax=Paenibacillus glycanilyticus TaxID=126569 RepID=A0ABQ6GEH9_9BACL|nr:hypothetical protein [Paenibacillus glycanilyticus]GLX68001.1 hypothetical protein MU1_23460 [Paenibacillus glycanilyticus]
MKRRRTISIVLNAAFVLSVLPLLYLIQADKNSNYISGLMFFSIAFFVLGIGSTVNYYTIKLRKRNGG